jgi:hypothetical protein
MIFRVVNIRTYRAAKPNNYDPDPEFSSLKKRQKPSCPYGQGRLSLCKNYCGFFGSAGALVEPPAAASLSFFSSAVGGVAGVAGVAPEDALEPAAALVEPPAAVSLSFFSSAVGGVAGVAGVAPEAALEELDSSFFSMPTDAEPEAAPGALGVVVEPAEEDAEPDGGVVRETARSPASLSQPVSNPAPSARETATAKVESLMCGPPWLG